MSTTPTPTTRSSKSPAKPAAPATTAPTEATANEDNAPAVNKSTFEAYLARALDSLKQVAAKHMDPERLIKIALVARARTPKLMQCSQESILMSLMQAAEIGLEPNTQLQHAALVPRMNRKVKPPRMECTFLPMYRGLIELGRRCGVIRTARAVPIYSCDRYKIQEGLTHTIEHEPNLTGEGFGDPRKVVLIYAVAQLVDGSTEWTYMTKNQVERIRLSTATPNEGPWVDHWEEMAKKTVIRRLFKMLPLTIEVAKVIESDNEPIDLSVISEAAAALEEGDDKALPSGDEGKDMADEVMDRIKKGENVAAPAGAQPELIPR